MDFSYNSNYMIIRSPGTHIPKPWLALSASSPRGPRALKAMLAMCPHASSAKDKYGFTCTVFHTVAVFSYSGNCMNFRSHAAIIPKPWLALSLRALRATLAICPCASSAKDE